MSEKIFKINTIKLAKTAATNSEYSYALENILKCARRARKYEGVLYDPYGSFEAVIFRADNPSPTKTIFGLYTKAKIMLCKLNSQFEREGQGGFINEFLLNEDSREICLYLLEHVNLGFYADGTVYIITD